MRRSLGIMLAVVMAPAVPVPVPPSHPVPVPPSHPVPDTSSSRSWATDIGVPGECLVAPVVGPLLSRFVEPSCPFCAGRRTLGFAAVTGDIVRSPVRGRVHFGGSVVGSGYLTVVPEVDSSLLVTVGGVDSSSTAGPGQVPGTGPLRPLVPGSTVDAGQIIGTATGPVGLSLRRRAPSGPPAYLDPEPFLARWRIRARLVPLVDAPGRAAPASFGCRRVVGGGADGSPLR